jgi:myo-inositol 2-dehydrogenase/D-chiro-inositol 1-dehydrogenase
MGKSGRLRLGMIGVGKMGEQHAGNAYRFVAKAELAAVQDLDRGRAERLAESCGSPIVFDSPASLIESDEVDAVLIAAPDALHAELALACIRAGKPVLCEKPLAAAPEDGLRVMEAELKAGKRIVSMGFQRRFDPYHVAVKDLAASGAIGRPLLWKGVHRNVRAPYDSSGPFILVNTAGHDIDSARWLLGEEVLDVTVRGLRSRTDLPEDSRDLLLLQMTMSGNCFATAEIFMSADYGYEVSAELVGQCGTVTTSQPERLCIRAKAQRGVPVASDWTAPFQDAYLAELNAWVDSVQAGMPFAGATTWDGYVAMKVSAAASASLLENRTCRVELMEKPSLYCQ